MSKNIVKICLEFVFFLIAIFIPLSKIMPRDFHDPVEMEFPLGEKTDTGFLDDFFGLLEYSNSCICHDDWDSFYIKLSGAPELFQYRNRFATNAYFSSILMNSPVRDNEKAANIGNFWMNAVQFEYGLNFQTRIAGFDSVYSYSRSSQHPFREDYSYAACDRQILRFRPSQKYEVLRITFLPSVMFEYSDLYDFWKSDLEKPRKKYVAAPGIAVEIPLTHMFLFYCFAQTEIIYTWENETEADFYFETGFRKTGSSATDLFLQIFYTGNSEILEDRKHEAFYAGLAVRFSGN